MSAFDATQEPQDRAAALAEVQARVSDAARQAGRDPASVNLIAVSKTFDSEAIRPVIAAGQRVFGENRVQEAMAKWPALRDETAGLAVSLIGPLQSNKARDAVAFFDAIHTVDRDKIAGAIASECRKLDRQPQLFVQVNTGAEPQKSGILPEETDAFVKRCQTEHGLTIAGLMCIPPFDEAPGPHFALLAKIAKRLGLPRLSMGMSGDYETAIAFGATDVRVGSAIFGVRDSH